MKCDKYYNSENRPTGEEIQLAAGHISSTAIEFTNENIVVTIEAKKGEVVFYDMQDNILASISVALPDGGDGKFSEVMCKAENSRIMLGFPEYTYKDNYPNCDGEYDRWTKIVSGYNYVVFDTETNTVI